MGSSRKWIAALLAFCVAVTTTGYGVHAQNMQQNEGIEQESLEEGVLNFIMMENTCIRTPGTQNVVASVGQENTVVEQASLTYRNTISGQEFTVEAAGIVDNMVRFTMEYTDVSQKGIYELVNIWYCSDGREYDIVLSDSGMDVRYGVEQEVDAEPDEILMDPDVLEEVEANVVTLDENGNTVSEQTMEDVLKQADAASPAVQTGRASVNATKKMVIVLDPGHDSTHAGARGNGVKEEEAVLKIAQYCKAELQKYSGVTVYMTRTTNACANGGKADCNYKRVEFAVSKKADVFVSLHLNSSPSTSPRGAGVYYPNSNYRPQIGAEGKGLAIDIYQKLSALGLPTWAGGYLIRNSEDNTRYDDGSLADYLCVIRESKKAGIPAVLVEHAFLSNAADVAGFVNSDEKLKNLGVADAQGIAQYYGLKLKSVKPAIDWIQSRGSKTLRVNWQETAGAVSYQLYRSTEADGKYKKIAEVDTCRYDNKKLEAGTTYYYKVRAVFADGTKSAYSKVVSAAPLAAPQITGIRSKAAGRLNITWSAVEEATGGYELWRSETIDGTYTKIITTAANTYIDKDITTQKEYFYKVRVRGGDRNGYSTCSEKRSGWAVQKTSIKSVSSEDSTSLRIRWKKVANAEFYRIQRSTSKKGTYKTIAEVKGSKSTYVDKGLKEKKKYYYRIQVWNRVDGKKGCSSYSSPAAGQTIIPTSMVYAKSVDSSTMELKWKKDDQAYAYSIKRSMKKNGVYEKIAEIRDCNIIKYEDKSVVGGARYYYVVETIIDKKGVKGYSGNSQPVSAYSLPKVEITSIQKVDNGMLVQWESVPGANCYEIMRSTKKSSGYIEIAKVRGKEAAAFTDLGVEKGSKYYYRIRAVSEGKRTGYGSYGKVAQSSTY